MESVRSAAEIHNGVDQPTGNPLAFNAALRNHSELEVLQMCVLLSLGWILTIKYDENDFCYDAKQKCTSQQQSEVAQCFDAKHV